MAQAGFVGLTWTDQAGRTRATKFNWNKQKVRSLIGAAAAIALQKAGLEVRRNTQRSMVGGGTPMGRRLRSKPQWWHVGEKDGYPVVAFVRKVPRPDKVSSWAPKAALRNDVQSDFDNQTNSVVIGPSKFPWLNQLHEFGGSVNVHVQTTRFPVQDFGGHKVPQKFQRREKLKRRGSRLGGAYVGLFDNTRGSFTVGRRTVRGRAYMEIGLQKSLPKIPAQFRDTMRFGYGKIRVFEEKGFRG